MAIQGVQLKLPGSLQGLFDLFLARLVALQPSLQDAGNRRLPLVTEEECRLDIPTIPITPHLLQKSCWHNALAAQRPAPFHDQRKHHHRAETKPNPRRSRGNGQHRRSQLLGDLFQRHIEQPHMLAFYLFYLDLTLPCRSSAVSYSALCRLYPLHPHEVF